MDITDIKTFLAAPMAEVSALMDESLKSDIALLDATNRSLLSQGGKMMRPVLSLLAAGACGGIKADSIRFAAAAEMIHNATLLHDDVVDGPRSCTTMSWTGPPCGAAVRRSCPS